VLLGRTEYGEFIVSEDPICVITSAELTEGGDQCARALLGALESLDNIVSAGM
jgi:hypothetical protein